jgi:hypothetical protein
VVHGYFAKKKGAKMSESDPATAENPPSEIGAGDVKRGKGPSPDTAAEAGVGGLDAEETPEETSEDESSTGTGGNKRKKGPSPDTAAEAGVGGLD